MSFYDRRKEIQELNKGTRGTTGALEAEPEPGQPHGKFEGGLMMAKAKELMARGPENAESGDENINNLMLADSLDRVAQANYGDNMAAMYKTKNTEGQQRFIKRYSFGMLANEESWKRMDNNLRKEITQNPAFSDTLDAIKREEFMQEMRNLNRPNIMQRGTDWLKRKAKSFF